MTTLYLTEDLALVRRDTEDCLLVQIPERRDAQGATIEAVKKRLPLNKIEDVVVMGEVTLTASAVHLLLERNIEIHYLTPSGKFAGKLSPGLSKNSLLRLAQHQAHHDLTRRADLARRFALGKLANQRTILRRHRRRQEDPHIDAAITAMTQAIHRLRAIATQARDPAPILVTGDTGIHGTAIEQILAAEGQGSAAYFGVFGEMISDGEQWPFPGRIARPPGDPINALLSFGYALLASQVSGAVQLVGFDPYVGFLHSSVYGRPALALDLMEEFRPIIVAGLVLHLLNNRMISRADFATELGNFRLKDEPRKLFLRQFEERLREEITNPIFTYKASYRRCLELQARLLAKLITGEIEQYPPLIVR